MLSKNIDVEQKRELKVTTPTGYLIITLQFDDHSRNGYRVFSITAEKYDHDGRELGCGCLHDEIAEYCPTLAPYIKWHLMGEHGPMYYLANTLYWAGDRDHHGLRKGEQRQKVAAGGKLMWCLQAVNQFDEQGDSMLPFSGADLSDPHRDAQFVPIYLLDTLTIGEQPQQSIELVWQPVMRVGEGKERRLDLARSAAVWPEATDEELMAEGLKDRLMARLPQLLHEFQNAMEELGFEYT